MSRLTALALVLSSIPACMTSETPNLGLSLQVRSDVANKEAIGRIHRDSSLLAGIRTEQSISSSDEYVEDLADAWACVRLRSWTEEIKCAGCPPRRDYGDVIAERCEPLVLAGTEAFSVTAANLDGDEVTLFVERVVERD